MAQGKQLNHWKGFILCHTNLYPLSASVHKNAQVLLPIPKYLHALYHNPVFKIVGVKIAASHVKYIPKRLAGTVSLLKLK